MTPLDPAVHVGSRIRDARKAAGLTQSDLATRLRTTQEYVSRVERGNATPSVANLYEWAKALEVEAGWLLDSEPLRKNA